MMVRFLIIAGLMLCAGCQTTRTDSSTAAPHPFERLEQLTVRVDQYVGTYDVIVTRSRKVAPDSDEWETIYSHHVAGHPNKWLRAGPVDKVPGYEGSVLFWIDNTTQEAALGPGVNLSARVAPKTANTVILDGVYSQISGTQHGLEELCIPFRLECAVGRSYVVYRKQVRFEGLPTEKP